MPQADGFDGIGRRSFLGGTMATVGVGMVAGAMSATGVASATPTTPAAPGQALPSWEHPPAPIPDSLIGDTVVADLVVVGAGCAGIFTAFAAAEAGARVVVIEKMDRFSARGIFSAAVNTKAHRRAGISIDAEKLIAELLAFAGNRVHQGLIRMWAENSGEIFDRIIDVCEANGLETVLLSQLFNPDTRHPYLYPTYPTGHAFMTKDAVASGTNVFEASQADLLRIFERLAKQAGVQFHYSMPSQRLLVGPDGKVTGVVAGSPEGYTAYRADTAVVLASGGYTENDEMLRAWCPAALEPEIKTYTPAGGNTGDGFNMALWIGAAMQKWPHPSMVHTINGWGVDPMAVNPSFMQVNKRGIRFNNESLPTQNQNDGRFMQPGKKAWSVFDDKWEHDHETIPAGFGGPITETREDLRQSVADGLVLAAETLEGLAQAMDVPVDAFTASVARYNGLSRQGRDDDFGKDPSLLLTIERAPFYAIPIKSHLLIALGGLDVDPSMQVLDRHGDPIGGLYAAGNAMGNFFANEYPLIAGGLSHGRCIVLGTLLGRRLATTGA